MIEAALVTILPAGFLIIIFGGGAAFLRKKIEQDGEAPINRRMFYASKYSVILIWGIMAFAAFGIGYSPVAVPQLLQIVALAFWVFGFALLYLGRLEMGDSFRLGSPKEATTLKVNGLFGLSRNPMYAGLYATIGAAALYTLNPVVVLTGVFVIAVHHAIVLAEERRMRRVFGQNYVDYCGRVSRYFPSPGLERPPERMYR